MYNIYYNIDVGEGEGIQFVADVNTSVKAFMVAVKEMRRVLSTQAVEFLCIGEMEFVLWAYGKCAGYLSIKEVGPDVSGRKVPKMVVDEST